MIVRAPMIAAVAFKIAVASVLALFFVYWLVAVLMLYAALRHES